MSEHSLSQAQSQYEGVHRMVQALDFEWETYLDLVQERKDLQDAVAEAEYELDEAEREFLEASEEDAEAMDLESEVTAARNKVEECQSAVTAFDNEHQETLEQGAELVNEFDLEDKSQDEIYDAVRERIEEDPLSAEVRSGWASPGTKLEAEEFRLTLCTGGPAVQIVGTLNLHGEPDYATLQHQDWFEGWTDHTPAISDVLVRYASCFYFNY